ncbi:hypothetical protein OF83DRAFT_504143 [Amylostereum chailletii]|nr:hypothetical protein OF83DRAFT_504143 [Amylostereum chailletii]
MVIHRFASSWPGGLVNCVLRSQLIREVHTLGHHYPKVGISIFVSFPAAAGRSNRHAKQQDLSPSVSPRGHRFSPRVVYLRTNHGPCFCERRADQCTLTCRCASRTSVDSLCQAYTIMVSGLEVIHAGHNPRFPVLHPDAFILSTSCPSSFIFARGWRARANDGRSNNVKPTVRDMGTSVYHTRYAITVKSSPRLTARRPPRTRTRSTLANVLHKKASPRSHTSFPKTPFILTISYIKGPNAPALF